MLMQCVSRALRSGQFVARSHLRFLRTRSRNPRATSWLGHDANATDASGGAADSLRHQEHVASQEPQAYVLWDQIDEHLNSGKRKSLGQSAEGDGKTKILDKTIDGGVRYEGAPDLVTRKHDISIEAAKKPHRVPRKHVPDDVLEYWSTIPAPTFRQRQFANSFFTTSRPRLLFTAGSLHQVTFTDVPEVAFLGRSNVGKSTLLNALLGQNVARTSRRPGKTKTLNAWAAGGQDATGKRWRLTVLDMPGYGHGSREEWGKAVTKYLRQRKELKRAFVLINAVHGMKDTDRMMLAYLRDAAIPHQIVLSKVDEVFEGKARKGMSETKMANLLAEHRLAKIQTRIEEMVEAVRMEGKGQNDGLPAMEDVLGCSGESSGFPGANPEPRNTLGIAALRCSILTAAGIRPPRKVKDEKDLSFVE